MKILLKILNIFFVFLGVVFFIIIIGLSYLWIADPFNIKSIIPSGVSPISAIKTIIGKSDLKIDNIDKNPFLDEEQEAWLESMGIEPADLPSEITPEMERCFIQKLGEKRANEIIQGDLLNATDFLKANSCLD